MEMVNGFVCKDCSDVALAKRSIDPAHPKDGPNGRDSAAARAKQAGENAVLFGGNLAHLNDTQKVTGAGAASDAARTATRALPRVDLTA